ncbi:AfsR/SARP family transcriptional regulator [Plantactinospora endophytica]|uniref:Transcriptional regulator n=1 Tax=Plantactinospora endophytica TaxID=673535 RepID=A0ABQ4EDH0_9ACTN|nr:BTAD domain-containing putative transcriptional regulator [Plantactinospora endophytica]GIG92297.1 transcriptional regulator [Plantactinospora endophytica]
MATDAGAVPIGGPRQRTVLAMLSLSPDRVVSVDRLFDALWGGRPPTTGRTQVAICIAGLRKCFRKAGIEGEVVRTVPSGYVLVSQGNRIDAVEFQTKVNQAQALVTDGDLNGAVDLLGQALALWRGRALSDVAGDVVESAAVQLEEQRFTAYEQFLELRLRLGQHRELVGDLTTLVDERPLREHTRALLMLALYRSGRRAEALEVFRKGRRLYIDELGLEPGATLQRLHAACLRGEAAPSLGEQPAAPTGRGNVVPAQLPRSLSVFVGRAEEQETLDELLTRRSADGPLPLGVISGPAGIGKSALAVQWARQHADAFPDGQLYADLRAYGSDGEPGSVEPVLARFLRALGVPADAMPAQLADRVALYCSLVNNRRLLLVLDNADSLAQVELLLPGSGTCCALLTTRRHHDLAGAIGVRLGRLRSAETVELLRATVGPSRVDADPAATALLGEQCEGLPLAVTVAATRLAAREHWTMPRMVARLADPDRRLGELSDDGTGGVRASLEVSYRRLDPAAALMFRRLGLLGGPTFPVSVAASLLDTTPFDAETLTERLVDAQLLEPTEYPAAGSLAYRMSELVRLYARERADVEDRAEDLEAARVRAHTEWAALGNSGCPTAMLCGSCFLIEPNPSVARTVAAVCDDRTVKTGHRGRR